MIDRIEAWEIEGKGIADEGFVLAGAHKKDPVARELIGLRMATVAGLIDLDKRLAKLEGNA